MMVGIEIRGRIKGVRAGRQEVFVPVALAVNLGQWVMVEGGMA